MHLTNLNIRISSNYFFFKCLLFCQKSQSTNIDTMIIYISKNIWPKFENENFLKKLKLCKIKNIKYLNLNFWIQSVKSKFQTEDTLKNIFRLLWNPFKLFSQKLDQLCQFSFECQGCICSSSLYPVRNHCTCIQTTNDVCIRLIVISSAAVGIVSEQPRTYIYVQNRQRQQPRKNMSGTKGIFKKLTWK